MTGQHADEALRLLTLRLADADRLDGASEVIRRRYGRHLPGDFLARLLATLARNLRRV